MGWGTTVGVNQLIDVFSDRERVCIRERWQIRRGLVLGASRTGSAWGAEKLTPLHVNRRANKPSRQSHDYHMTALTWSSMSDRPGLVYIHVRSPTCSPVCQVSAPIFGMFESSRCTDINLHSKYSLLTCWSK